MHMLILRLLAKCLIFAVPFVPLNIYLYNSSPFFAKEKEYHATIEGFFAKDQVTHLIIGDSHPGALTNDMLGEHTYNLAFGGDGLKENYLKLKYVLERSESVEYLLLTADAQMFGKRRVQSSNNSFLNPYVLKTGTYEVYGHNAVSILADMVPLFNDSYIEYLNKNLQDRISGNIAKRNLYEQLRQDHYMWSREISPEQRLEFALKTGKSDHKGVMADSIQQVYYRKIFDLCAAYGVKVIGVKYPAMREYIAGLEAGPREQLESFFASLPFHAMLDYRDFTQDPLLMKNEDHVNDDGARLLLKRMEADTGLRLTAAETSGPLTGQ
ncbi:MAG: hypothetical protein OHK0039_32770 [Bacteroidia bacterium]